ncbi:MAG: FAD:protein FMN transferase [Candidatus Omnitrophota bacterium]|jgi:thiamine biosynthesis lipoprotein
MEKGSKKKQKKVKSAKGKMGPKGAKGKGKKARELELQKDLEKERKKAGELELHREEEERQRKAKEMELQERLEKERRKTEEIELRRKEELEKQQAIEKGLERDIESEKQKINELELHRRMEEEKHRARELELHRGIDMENQRARELDVLMKEETEKHKARMFELQAEIEKEKLRFRDLEILRTEESKKHEAKALELQRSIETEKQKVSDLELRSKKEAEKQRVSELELLRSIESEKKITGDLELRVRQELEKQRAVELELKREIDAEKRKTRELERRRSEEEKKQRARELSLKKSIEREKRKAKQLERKRRKDAGKRRVRQIKLKKIKETEERRRREAERRLLRGAAIRKEKTLAQKAWKPLTAILAVFLLIKVFGHFWQPGEYSRTIPLMGTFVEIKAYGDGFDRKKLPETMNAAIDLARRLEKKYSIYDTESEVNKLNKEGMRVVSIELFNLINKAVRMSRITGGAFDITVAPILKANGFYKDMPAELLEMIPDDFRGVGIKNVSLKLDNSVWLHNNAWIDLSGIAKGNIVDSMKGFFREKGLDNVMINAGGDLYCGAKEEGEPWIVGVREPGSDQVLLKLAVKDMAVATSGDYENVVINKKTGEVMSHIIDPFRDVPVKEAYSSVTVIAPLCTDADALATGMMVMNKDEAITLANGMKDVSIIVVTTSGKRHMIDYSEGAEDYVIKR